MTTVPAVSSRRPWLVRHRRLVVVLVIVGALILGLVVWAGPRASSVHGGVDEEFAVPSSTWWGLSGMLAEVGGTLTFDEHNCPIIDAGPGYRYAVVLPWAVGVTYEDGTRAVVHRFTGGVYAVEGREFSYAGGYHEPHPGESWTSVCPDSGVAGDAYVNDWPG